MKLDRNINGTGRGKYGLVKTRRLAEIEKADSEAAALIRSGGSDRNRADRQAIHLGMDVAQAIALLETAGVIEWGQPGTESEFFVIKLRDQCARPALDAYADMAAEFDPEYECEIRALSARAGFGSEFCKKPD